MSPLDEKYWYIIASIGLALSLNSVFVLSLGEQFAISIVASSSISLIEFIHIHLGLMILGGGLIIVSIQMHESIGYRENAKQLEKRHFDEKD